MKINEQIKKKKKTRYRVIAFDHDLFSYTDTKLDEWPVVIITNPKDAGFLLPTHEPLHRLPLSTHIRVLAFSIAEVMTVEISLDNGPFESATPKGGSLWVLPWKPQTLGSGLHQITVKVVDAKGNTKFKKNNFSVDGTLDQINWIARFILLTDFTLAVSVK